MRINEIVEIIHGNLLNNPPLSAFENVTTNLANVRRGSLFIATTPQSAKEAKIKLVIETAKEVWS